MSQPDLQPDELEALQAETTGQPQAPVRVHVDRVDAPVRVQPLPRKSAGTRTRIIGTTAVKFLAADHRRASATVISIGQSMLIATTNAATGDVSTMAEWPASVPFVLTADSELWIASKTATTTISVITEFWATGE